MIKIINIDYSYRKHQALYNINFEIKPGLTGLIGENGAGKTTIMNILSTLTKNQKGTVEILGKSLNKSNLKFIRENVGYMPQEFDFYSLYKVRDVLMYLAILNDIDKEIANQRMNEILTDLNLIDKKDTLVNALSGGMKRRLGLACALIKAPRILILDEPTVGLDPKERINMRNYLKKYSKDRAVVMSTHIVDDIEKICDNIVIISNGKSVFSGTKDELLSFELFTYEIECAEEELSEYEELGNITNLEYINNGLKFRITLNMKIDGKIVDNTVEDVYMYLIGNKDEIV